MAALLELEGVTAGYGGGDILHELDLSVEEGGITCIVGPNGAGKSTVLRVVSGLLRPRLGALRFRGASILGLSPRAILQRGIVQVPQERSLFPTMTVWENVRMGAYTVRDQRLIDRRLMPRTLDLNRLPALAEKLKELDELSTKEFEQRINALGTARVRAGYALDDVLLYATAGLAYGRAEIDTSITDQFAGLTCGPAGFCAAINSKQWLMGWAAGVGFDWSFLPRWSFRTEYLHYDLGSIQQSLTDPAVPNFSFTSSTNFRGDILRGAINYKFF